LAVAHQRLHARAAKWVYYLAASAVTVAVVQSIFKLPMAVIGLEILAMATTLALLRVSRQEQWHEQWLCNRNLAENLRTLLFTCLVLPSAVRQSLFDRLSLYGQPESWIVEATEWIGDRARDAPGSSWPFERVKQFLVTSWLLDQATFFCQTARSRRHAVYIAHRLTVFFFLATIVMASLRLLAGAYTEHHTSEVGRLATYTNLIMVLAIFMPAWGAAIQSVSALLDHERIAERSDRMTRRLEKLVARIRQTSTLEELVDEVQKAAQLLMNENHEWRVSLSFRGLKAPSSVLFKAFSRSHH
jgi:hypothetical protein